MSQSAKSLLLTEQIGLLVRHYGISRVRAAVAKVKVDGDERSHAATHTRGDGAQRPLRIDRRTIESIRDVDPEKYRVLSDFLNRLKDRRVLPESQDIRYFAQTVGLKEISGKSREDLIPKLMRFLIDQPIDKLRADVESASGISEQQRQMGFSVLTDKLLRTH